MTVTWGLRAIVAIAIFSLLLPAGAAWAQDEGLGEIIVTGSRRAAPGVIVVPPPVIGLRRQADSAVRDIEIISDSRDAALRRREVEAMLLAAIDRAKRDGFNLVTGQFELVEVTRANWQDRFPGLAGKVDPAEDDDDDGDNAETRPRPALEDDGSSTLVRLKVKTRLDGSIDAAAQKLGGFVKSVPATGRSQIVQRGSLALTIINPEQYRDEIHRRIAAGAKHALSFYDPGYGLEITGLDQGIAWKQISNTELFLYIPYSFTVRK